MEGKEGFKNSLFLYLVMANEAVIVELINGGEPISLTVADGATIEKGTLLQLTDPRTGSASAALETFAGIAAAEKVISDGATTLAVWTKGVFDLVATAGPAISAGQLVRLSGANLIAAANLASHISGGYIIGKALESTAAGTTETIQVLVGAGY